MSILQKRWPVTFIALALLYLPGPSIGLMSLAAPVGISVVLGCVMLVAGVVVASYADGLERD